MKVAQEAKLGAHLAGEDGRTDTGEANGQGLDDVPFVATP